MVKSNFTLVFDPIPFKGGSKIATSDALNTCRVNGNQFIVLTVQPEFWINSDFYAKHDVIITPIRAVSALMKIHHGPLYWLNQLYLLLVLFITLLRHRGITKVVGASGPGIDMAIYLLRRVAVYEIIQFVHGSVGLSRSIGYCLTQADAVFYLPSARESLKAALQSYLQHKTNIADASALAESYLCAQHYHSFANGLPQSRWPTPCQTQLPICFWAASLLKWKGLDLIVDAIKLTTHYKPIALNICFIRPVDTCLPVSQAPINLSNCQWFEDPQNLDEIRSQSNIFISTSQNEPFGLSILEALAAGMCVLIPQDGAYWDQQLVHNRDCIKYQPGDVDSLANALLYAVSDQEVFDRCRQNAGLLAKHYRAEIRYKRFAQYINGDLALTMARVIQNS